jgi:alkyldihydroxyacetonephosphate synthase
VAAFPNVQAGLDALRFMMQRELRPAVARLYDEVESLHRTRGQAPFDTHPILAIFEFSGMNELATVERDLAIDIIGHRGGRLLAGSDLYDEWLANRFGSLSTGWQARDHYVDTMEIVASWRALPRLYDDIRAAVRALSPDFYFGAHWSHVYPEGACQYMTVRLPPLPEDEALSLLRRAWNQAQEICLAAGGSIAHHHGIGLFRGTWFRRQLGATGWQLLEDLKTLVDPGNLLVPGKLGLGIENERAP